jgi:hypothetical protein
VEASGGTFVEIAFGFKGVRAIRTAIAISGQRLFIDFALNDKLRHSRRERHLAGNDDVRDS